MNNVIELNAGDKLTVFANLFNAGLRIWYDPDFPDRAVITTRNFAVEDYQRWLLGQYHEDAILRILTLSSKRPKAHKKSDHYLLIIDNNKFGRFKYDSKKVRITTW